MVTYHLHYCYYMPAPATGDMMYDMNNPRPPVQHHARLVLDLDDDLKYGSDVTWLESHLNQRHFDAGHIGCNNFQLLGWQRLSGQDRPAEGV